MKYRIYKDTDNTYFVHHNGYLYVIQGICYYPSLPMLLQNLKYWEVDKKDEYSNSTLLTLLNRSTLLIERDSIEELSDVHKTHPELLI